MRPGLSVRVEIVCVARTHDAQGDLGLVIEADALFLPRGLEIPGRFAIRADRMQAQESAPELLPIFISGLANAKAATEGEVADIGGSDELRRADPVGRVCRLVGFCRRFLLLGMRPLWSRGLTILLVGFGAAVPMRPSRPTDPESGAGSDRVAASQRSV